MKIVFVPNQPHCYAFGGFEVQMLSIFDALKADGINVIKLDPWSRDSDFDLVHVWGLEITQAHHINYARKSGKKIVATVLMPDLSTFFARLKFFVSGLIYKVKIQRELSRGLDAIIAVNESEKEIIHKAYGYPKERIHLIPHVVSPVYFDGISVANPFGINDYILCAGNICKRKNQLNLLRAANASGFTVLLLGNPIEGEEAYAAEVEKELSKNSKSQWLRNVPANSITLKAAYEHCRVCALVSYLENQPISILEAQAMNCKILIADRPYAKQELFKDIVRVDPDDVENIKAGLSRVLNEPATNEFAQAYCKPENVVRLHVELYTKILTDS